MAVARWSARERLDPRVESILGWMTPIELAFVGWFAREAFSGAGAAVELGCAFGRSTAATLQGLAANSRAVGRDLHVYDLMAFDWFLLGEYRKQPGCGESSYQLGDSFEPIFARNVEPWKDRVRLSAGDIATMAWCGEPIEYLFIDIMKSWDATRAVIQKFFPFLVPGLSCIVHQDYKHPYSPQIVLTMYRMREFFEPIYSVSGDGASTVVFRCARELDQGWIDTAIADGLCELSSYSIGEIDSAFDYSQSLVADDPTAEQALLRSARTVLFTDIIAARPESLLASLSVPSIREFVRERFRGFVAEDTSADAATAPPTGRRWSRLKSRLIARFRSAGS